jgi:hypothetical protein
MGSKYLNRRMMLRGMLAGVGAAIALPTLEAMLNSNGEAFADGTAIPKRFMTWFFGNGVILKRFVPTGEGASYVLSEQLEPLKNVKDYVSVLTGFNNRCEHQVTHHEGMTIFNGYTMAQLNGLFSKAGGPTIDQVIASRIAQNTPIPSAHVGISRRLSVMDSGTTMHYLSHKGTEEPQPPEFNPQAVWNALFNSFTPPEDPSGKLRVSVLDAVRDNTAQLRKRLGVKDNQRLDAHLEGINTLEKKIKALPPVCTKPGMPDEKNPEGIGNEPLTSTSEAMSDLLAYAFACDITRVASYLFIGGAAETVLTEIGHNNAHHNDTHSFPGAEQEINAGVIYFMQRLAYMLEKFKATPDGANGNLLDNTIVYCSSDCSEGWSHSIDKQPIILAGRGGDSLIYPGIHYNGQGGNPTDVLLTCLQAFDPTATEVGGGAPYSNTPCTAIKAG